jgi:hypothetical protein
LGFYFEGIKIMKRTRFFTYPLLLALFTFAASAQAADALTSWNDGPAKKAIVDFVRKVTKKGGVDFVPPPERIAVFDNDGTLWAEQPFYFQGLFALDRVRELAPQHPEWKQQKPFKAVLENDMKALAETGEHGFLELVMATHANMTSEEFMQIVKNWLATTKHPTLKRPWAEQVYGIPPEQVIGSSIKTKFEFRDDNPVLVRLPELNFIDDKAGKPVGINQYIGRRPIAAFGNSDGDLQMLQWTTASSGPRFGLIVHHDDAKREFAYDRSSIVGKLGLALAESSQQHWTVVSMSRDWKRVFSFQ